MPAGRPPGLMVPAESPRSRARPGATTWTRSAAVLLLALAASCVRASAAAAFANHADLKAAVDACLGVVSSGEDCCSLHGRDATSHPGDPDADGGICGVARKTNMPFWNTLGVTSMNRMFNTFAAFDQDIGQWDMSGVTNMVYVFQVAAAFNQDLSAWNVAAVTDMKYML